MAKPIIYFTVSNDLVYDQRMARICGSLAKHGFEITLVGRKLPASKSLFNCTYNQKRLYCIFSKGALFYAEYNIRLFIFLLTRKADAICAIDLDTILPVYFISKIKNCKRIYDAHELFCEMKEVAERPQIYRFWKAIEKMTVPRFRNGYTVNQPIASEFFRMYGVKYEIIRNVPLKKELIFPIERQNFVLYQGAVNEGRSFETLIPAMRYVNSKLIVAGDGNFMEKLKILVKQYHVEEKVELLGMIPPDELLQLTGKASAGITIFEKGAVSNFYSLANRFFDYMHGGIPQVCADYPAYREINDRYKIALLISDLSPESLAAAINELLTNNELWNELHFNCKKASAELNWQKEEPVLVNFYKKLFG